MNRARHLLITAMASAVVLMLCLPAMADVLGVPFFRNITAKEYRAHNRNFDVVCDNYGTVFVANFECLLYYNGHAWRKIYTPGINRITRVARGFDGRIWVGGHKVFGYLKPDSNGRLHLQTIVSDKSYTNRFDEIDFIRTTKDRVYAHTTDGKTYYVDRNDRLVLMKEGGEEQIKAGIDSTKNAYTPNKMQVTFEHGEGILLRSFTGKKNQLTESDGLISNAINFITSDQNNLVWGATDRGLFAMDVATTYTQLTEHQGLKGEVLCINVLNDRLYAGTMDGLFVQDGTRMSSVGGISLACWQLVQESSASLLAATADGVYRITQQGISKLTGNNTFAVCVAHNSGEIFCGEIDGIYRLARNGSRTLLANISKATKLHCNGNVIVAETIFGELWQINQIDGKSKCIRRNADPSAPKASYEGVGGIRWTTDPDGYNLTTNRKDNEGKLLNIWTYPLRSKSLNSIFVHNGMLIVGGDFGLITLNVPEKNAKTITKAEQPIIREITLRGDSVVWGGFRTDDMKPCHDVKGIDIPSGSKSIEVVFSSRTQYAIAPTLYRYRTNGGTWSAWSEETVWRDNSLEPGRLLLEVQAKDCFGRESGISTVNIYAHWPWFLRWWMMLVYVGILAWLVTMILKWRTKMLEADKKKLEAIVSKRTAQLSQAYEEQRKTSAELSETLIDLRKTQKDLVRMERTATAGKLTQGLIDRILNPINYINNFSRLTTGLAKDLRQDIEDERENMDEDNYDDCEDILDMMTQNLKKIEEHGINTTRTLRAMEAMLNNTVTALRPQDLVTVCQQVMSGAQGSYKDDIGQYGIDMQAVLPEHPVVADIDIEAMGRILMSMLSNSVYAVVKKCKAGQQQGGKITLTLTENADNAIMIIRDNGIGIEAAILEKVFDPFFTTKTTGEAAGVGLYLVRELIHDHNGNITARSEKNVYCEFEITLPRKH